MENLVRLVCCTAFLVLGYVGTVACINIYEGEDVARLEAIFASNVDSSTQGNYDMSDLYYALGTFI